MGVGRTAQWSSHCRRCTGHYSRCPACRDGRGGSEGNNRCTSLCHARRTGVVSTPVILISMVDFLFACVYLIFLSIDIGVMLTHDFYHGVDQIDRRRRPPETSETNW